MSVQRARVAKRREAASQWPRAARAMLALLVLAVPGPVSCLHFGTAVRDDSPVTFTEIAANRITPAARRDLGPFRLAGAWRLGGGNSDLTGFSGLVALSDGDLLAVSDRGIAMRIGVPPATGSAALRPLFTGPDDKLASDVEAVTMGSESGEILAALEQDHAIVRFDAQLRPVARIRPATMRDWPSNAGAEAFTRLTDGRFIAFAESVAHGDEHRHEALLFSGDPTRGGRSTRFFLAMPGNFRPTDAATLPDGTLLILGRRLLPPFRFVSVICHADLDDIRPGGVLRARMLARIDAAPLADNYEGMAVQPRKDGAITIWLISDANNAIILQQTLLLRLELASGEALRAAGSRVTPL